MSDEDLLHQIHKNFAVLKTNKEQLEVWKILFLKTIFLAKKINDQLFHSSCSSQHYVKSLKK
jgi:hypothetical protein